MKISVIITTKNNARTIQKCIESITHNVHGDYEIVVVDNFSEDSTIEIVKQLAEKYHIKLHSHGPERNTQRPHGFEKSSGDIVYFIDSDMYLESGLLDEIIQIFQEKPDQKALIIPETNIGGFGYWSKVKAFERSLYDGDDDIEAARVFTRELYKELGGHNKKLISGEDWDLSDRARKYTSIGRTKKRVNHDEGEIYLGILLKKKFYYGSMFQSYLEENTQEKNWNKIYIFRKSFYKNWKRYIKHPGLFLGFFLMINLCLISFTLGLFKGKYVKKNMKHQH